MVTTTAVKLGLYTKIHQILGDLKMVTITCTGCSDLVRTERLPGEYTLIITTLGKICMYIMAEHHDIYGRTEW